MTETGRVQIASIGTYLPPWEVRGVRAAGPDEDALTMAVAAGRAADPDATARRVVFVSRDFPLLEGGNGAALLAGLSLPADVPVAEVLGGGPVVLDQILAADDGTLVLASDADAAVGAGAVLVGTSGPALSPVSRQLRSLHVVARGGDGVRHTYADTRLVREIGVEATVARLGVADVVAVVGIGARELGKGLVAADCVQHPQSSASGVIGALADVVHAGTEGMLLAVKQSTAVAARLGAGSCPINRDKSEPASLPASKYVEGNGIPISLAAYSRAFDPKLRWEAAVFEPRPGIDAAPLFPPRVRVDSLGELADYRLTPLPRTGTVYTHTTVHIPVPDLPGPYSLAVVQLDGSQVRVLLKLTGVAAGQIEVGQPGSVVLRKIANRSGIPDYGYAFRPERTLGVSA